MHDLLYAIRYLLVCTMTLQIREKMSYLESSHRELLEIWQERQEEFEQHLDVQVFQRDAEQAEAWIALREALLSGDDIGVGLTCTPDTGGRGSMYH